MQYHGRTLIFVDTAGLRRQSKVKDSLEYYSALRTAKVVRDADVCLVLVDATEPIHVQDLKVAEQAWEAGAAVILVANKWDLVDKDHRTAPQFEKDLMERAPFLRWVPVLFTSALSGQRVRKCLDLVLQLQETRHQRVSTADVNKALEALLRRQPPPHSRGRRMKLRYGTQVSVAPPTFVFFCNLPEDLPEHYKRYVHNSLRDQWGFIGSPLRLRFREN
jgi:GTP-binding protein